MIFNCKKLTFLPRSLIFPF